MSGVDKSKSALLTFGGAGCGGLSSCASKMLGSFKGPMWSSKSTKKEAGKECCFETTVCNKKVKGCDDEPDRWDSSANWKMGCKKQVSGLTFGMCYNNDGKQWNTCADWGELYPGLNFYTGASYSTSDDCNLQCKMGVIWGTKTFGCAGEIGRDFCKNARTYKEKVWYEQGPFKLGANFAVGLNPFSWQKYNACLQYKHNDSLSLWLTHDSNKIEGDSCGLCLGTVGVSGGYKFSDGCYGVFEASKGRDGLKWAVGGSGKCAHTGNWKLAVDSDINFKASKSRKFGDNVCVTKWCSFSVDTALHHIADYEDWLSTGVKVTCDE